LNSIKDKRLLLIGDNLLTRYTLELFIEQQFSIAGVITQHIETLQLATKNKLLTNPETPCDYDYLVYLQHDTERLLSIPNNKPVIRYFESPTPYQGGYSTLIPTVCIKELKEYGICWLLEQDEETKLLTREIFTIEPQETAGDIISLCFAAALASIESALSAAIEKQGKPYPQKNIGHLHLSGLINWNSRSAKIANLARALSFEPYDNPYALLKLGYKNRLFHVKELQLTDKKSSHPPGTVTAIDTKAIYVASKDFDIAIGTIATLAGKIFSVEDLQQALLLKPGSHFDSLENEDFKNLNHQLEQRQKEELRWVKRLTQFTPSPSPFYGSNETFTHIPSRTEFNLAINTINTLKHKFDTQHATSIVVFLWLHYLSLALDNSKLGLGFSNHINYKPDLLSTDPLALSVEVGENNFKEQINKLDTLLSSDLFKQGYNKDTALRYQVTKRLATTLAASKIPITIHVLKKIREKAISAKAALEIQISEDGNKQCVFFNSNMLSQHQKKQLLTQIEKQFKQLTKQHCEPPLTNAFSIISDEEKKHLNTWNNTHSNYPSNSTLVQLIDECAQARPAASATSFQNETLSYSTLIGNANQLARYLLKKKIPAGSTIAICLNRGTKLFTAMLAASKCDYCFLCIDPSYPEERILYMLSDSDSKLLISEKTLSSLFTKSLNLPQIIELDTESLTINEESRANINLKSLDTPLYCVYTSGSTGKPKGITLYDKTIVNLVTWQKQQTDNQAKNIAIYAPLGFDVFIQEFAFTLMNGHHAFIIEENTRKSVDELINFCLDKKINLLFLPTSMLDIFCAAANNNKVALTDLKEIIIAGERLKISNNIQKFFSNSSTQLSNQYGPAETHVVSALELHKPTNTWPTYPAIGRPIANNQIYIFNRQQQLLPIGAIGEIYICGDNLAKGYIKNLDSEKFIYLEQHQKRFYRTGDLGRWLPSGLLECLGRKDDQVKIRGFRIEIGEIEAHFSRHPKILSAAVVVKKAGEQNYLAAYFTVEGDKTLFNLQELKHGLAKALPDYMLPAVYIILDDLPITANLKIDKKSLAASPQTQENTQKITKPKTTTGIVLRKQLAELLQLNPSAISMDKHFTEFGGSSILAMQIANQLSKKLNKQISPNLLLSCKDLENIATKLEETPSEQQNIPSRSILNAGPLLPNQEKLYFLYKELPDDPRYNYPFLYEINGKINVQALEAAISELSELHPTLRTYFIEHNGDVNQYVQSKRLELTTLDFTSSSALSKQKWLNNKAKQAFRLEEEFPCRIYLLKTSEITHELFIVLHHICFDTWALAKFNLDLSLLYKKHLNDPNITTEQASFSVIDYAILQQQQLAGGAFRSQLNYWLEKLSNPSSLQFKELRASEYEEKGSATHFFILDSTLFTKLELLAKEHHCTLFATLLSIFYILLFLYTGQEDLIIGTPSANRSLAETEKLIAFFANTLCLRSKLSRNLNFEQLLEQTSTTVLEATSNQDIPFDRIVAELKLPRDYQSNPLFETMFAVEPLHESTPQFKGTTTKSLPVDIDTSLFNLGLFLEANINGELQGKFEYKRSLFSKRFITRLCDDFKRLCYAICKNPSLKLNELDLHRGKQTLLEKKPEKTIPQLFAKIAKEHSTELAVSDGNTQLSYAELDDKSDQLATTILAKNPERKPVAIFLTRETAIITAALAIIKAGAAYFVITPDLPEERIKKIISHSDCQIILSNSKALSRLPKAINDGSHLILSLDEPTSINATNFSAPIISATDPAYLIYTSGSTGEPKGILQTQQTVSNLVQWQNTGEKKLKVSQFAAYSFDVSVQEIFFALLNGHELHLIPELARKAPSALLEFVKENEINYLFLPTAMLDYFCDEANSQNSLLDKLQHIVVAGEALKITQNIRSFFSRNSHTKLHNHYGPAETHVVSEQVLKGNANYWPKFPAIGRAINNTQLHVLNKYLQPVPQGTSGQLFVAGTPLAIEYLKQADLTQEKFILHPRTKQRLYATGDLVFEDSQHRLHYLGRIDKQVKIRGFRIELGEIEAQILKSSLIKNCAVVIKSVEGNPFIIAYLESNLAKLAIADLKQTLASVLPNYMLPNFYIPLDNFPLTANGKISTKHLPEPDWASLQESTSSPSNPTEETVAHIWENILGFKQTSMTNSFFDAGGNSLLTLKLLAEIKATFHIKLSIADIFNYQTIRQLSERIQLNESSTISNQPLIQLKKSNSKNNLFLIHPVGGSVFWYHHLVRDLETPINIYAIQDPAVSNNAPAFSNFKEMAAYYCGLIQAVQPHGPYYLGGASFGGTMAIEIAKQLTQQQQATKAIFLFDSWAYYPERAHDQEVFYGFMEQMHSRLKQEFKQLQIADLDRWTATQWERANLLWNYTIPEHISEPLILFKASEHNEIFEGSDDAYNFWNRHAKLLTVNLVPGDHESMFEQPAVSELARLFDNSLKSTFKN
jgi:amino acid adenylation domain-containing protein